MWKRTFRIVLGRVIVEFLFGLVIFIAAIGIVWIAWIAAHVGELTLVALRNKMKDVTLILSNEITQRHRVCDLMGTPLNF